MAEIEHDKLEIIVCFLLIISQIIKGKLDPEEMYINVDS
jgi:hypothetical protein